MVLQMRRRENRPRLSQGSIRRRHMGSFWRAAALASLISFIAPIGSLGAFGQSSLTSVRGTISDPSGAVVPGTKVEARNGANGQVRSQTANEAGEYQFQQMPPGTYVISASSPGFGAQAKRAELLVDQPATVNFELTIQASTTTVDVSAQAQTLNDQDAT